MTREIEAADRSEEVRAAARAWNRAGAIDERTLDAVVKEYPDDRSRLKPAFRVLLFLFTLVAAGSAFAVLAVNDVPVGALLGLAAVGSIATTELQIGKLRRADAGAEEATAFLSFWFLVAFLAWLLEGSGGSLPWRFLSGVGAVVAALAAWRWGLSFFGALSAACLFFSLCFWSGARISWIFAALGLVAPLLSAGVSPRLAPSHRRAADRALVTVLGALYLAIHLGSCDSRLLERVALLGPPVEGWVSCPGRPVYIAATALLPPILLAGGILLRRPLLLRMGVLFGVASLITLRFYVHLAPLWIVLLLSGVAAVALGMLLNRFFENGLGGERHGFTAKPLYEDARSKALDFGLGMAPAPGAPGTDTPGKPGFQGAGGDYGGGGASGKY